MRVSTIFLAVITLVAFATNSILCRQALMSGSIGPLEFTFFRLGSGMVVLLPLLLLGRPGMRSESSGRSGDEALLRFVPSNVWPAIALFGYAIFFSLAYVQLEAGAGALILFASVQISMIGLSIIGGGKVTPLEWAGLVVALSGLVYLLLPGLSAPPALGTILMTLSGVSWGVYSVLGQGQSRPIVATARNFLFCLPGVIILGGIMIGSAVKPGQTAMSVHGVSLAVLSGGVTSGLGYVAWYLTVRRITITVASVSQLAVPVLVALGGILFLNEAVTLRLVVASILIIGGIILTMLRPEGPQTAAAPAEVEGSGAHG